MSKKREIGSWERECYNEINHENILEGYKSIYLGEVEEKKIKKIDLTEKKQLESIEMKKRYIKENFLGDYPKELINTKFVYNDKLKCSYDIAIKNIFLGEG